MKNKHAEIDIATDKCSGCGMCAAVCSKGVFAIRDNGDKLQAVSVWSVRCTGCMKCSIVCPRKAINIDIYESNTVLLPAF